MSIRVPPPNASTATAPDTDGKLYAPSAARNVADLIDIVSSVAPETGNALEIASGTGQHITAFAAAMPAIHWHPSEVEKDRLSSIQAYIRESGRTNISAPITLDATRSGWGSTIKPMTLVLVTNLLHLISKPEVITLLTETERALVPSGQLLIYGPFKRDGKLTSEGDAKFDAGIRASDPEVGYKDDAWVKTVAGQAGLAVVRAQEMPANNLVLVFQKP